MKKDSLKTKYLSIFLLICLMADGILLCCLSPRAEIWNRWMAMVPIIYMLLGAFYTNLMKKNVDEKPDSLKWLYAYKGIKILISIIMIGLYSTLIKQSAKLFLVIVAASYLIALIAETCVYTDYVKHGQKTDNA